MPQKCICNNGLVKAALGNEDERKQYYSGHRWTIEVQLTTAAGGFLFATIFRPPHAVYEVGTSNLYFVV
jgi:hypothetical protein